MRITTVLCRQHIDRMFKKHWRVQGSRVPLETRAEKELKDLGIPVFDPQEVIKEAKKTVKLDIVGFGPKPIPQDHTHPDYHKKPCYFHRDNNVLLLGIDQAKNITNSVEIQEGLPTGLQNEPAVSKEVNKKVEEVILSAHLFDAEQKKLPKIKDPLRPAWNFPRIYGITQERSCKLITSKLLHLCEMTNGDISNDRMLFNEAQFFVPLIKEDDNIFLELNAEQMLLSKKPLNKFTNDVGAHLEVPSIFPVHYTNTLVPENIYKFKNLYPIKNILKYHPHTIFVHYDATKVHNLYEEDVTEEQILGRSLMKTFTAAASYARARFGNDVKLLPEPVNLQCIHTDGRMFHFAVLQLNTLDINNSDVKNIWYSMPRIPLFSYCGYKIGKPTLEGYNPDVIKYLLAFYKNM